MNHVYFSIELGKEKQKHVFFFKLYLLEVNGMQILCLLGDFSDHLSHGISVGPVEFRQFCGGLPQAVPSELPKRPVVSMLFY